MNDRLSFHLFTFGAGQSGLIFALCNLSFALCKGKWPNPLAAILWIHLLQLRYSLSNPAMEDDAAGHDHRWHLDRGAPLHFYEGEARVRRRRQNKEGKRDPETHQIKKGNQWYYRFAEGFAYGMKVHIGVDKDTGLIRSVVITAANALDLPPAAELLDSDEDVVFGRRPGKRRALPNTSDGKLRDLIETAKAHIRSKVEHPFGVISTKSAGGHSSSSAFRRQGCVA